MLTHVKKTNMVETTAGAGLTDRFVYLRDTKQLAKRRNKGEAQKAVKDYAVYSCKECETEFTILKSNMSRMRKCAFRDHLASCPEGTEAERKQNGRHRRGREVSGKEAVAMQEIESYAFRRE